MENEAVILSVDEIMLALFGLYAGEKHDEYTEKTKKYLLEKAVQIVETGTNVILDWGFWRKVDRASVKEFFSSREIEHEFHYLDISDEEWKTRLDKRNHAVLAGELNAYIVDDNLAAKFSSLFQMPEKEEMDVWVEQHS